MPIDCIKRRKLQELFFLTADAFGRKPTDISGCGFEEGLAIYAAATQEFVKDYLAAGSAVDALKRRLYKNAYRWGKSYRKLLFIGTWRQSKAVMRILYKMIGIDLNFTHNGRFIVKSCFFAKFYSPDVCRAISALDAGLAAGLSNGGRFRFKHRLTENRDCCDGIFERCTYHEESYCGGKRSGRRGGGQGASRKV